MSEVNKIKINDCEFGKGVFSKQIFFKNEIIWKLKGDAQNTPTRSTIHIGNNKHVDDPYGIYFNHSFNPNCKICGRNVIALKNIEKDEHLTFDYTSSELYIASPFKTPSGMWVKKNQKKEIGFITGITGQDGSYLTELLLEKGYKVYGIVRRTSSLYNDDRLKKVRDKITLRYGDMTDGAALQNYIHEIIRENPEFKRFEIYNLAAQSHVKISFEIPEYTTLVDGIGTLKLLEIIRALDKPIRYKFRIYQAGTSEMYGKVLEIPQNENTPFNPISPYAAAKVYAHHLVKIYRDGYGIFGCNGILFNHESSRRGQNFLTMKVINGIKDIIAEKKELIQIGNLNSKRDWGHAKDYVRGMWLMLQQEVPDDYVLATGKTYTVREFITAAFAYKNITLQWHKTGLEEYATDQLGNTRVTVNQKYYRPCEVDLLLGDPEKAMNKLGWNREYNDLSSLIKEMFD